jgi:hypothetical protein
MTEITALLALVRTDFFYFVWKCFDTIVQEKQFVANWHIKAVAHELMRTQRGETTRLIINQPPRSLKSICVSVAYVAWLLGHDPRRRIIVVSYSNELAAELHRQFRMVIDSEWYKQAKWRESPQSGRGFLIGGSKAEVLAIVNKLSLSGFGAQ